MTILITLTTIGTDCSLFDIYSNVDGFISAFETDVPKASLSTGFSSANVPDGTTVIRVKAKGVCTNYIDINLSNITTTTTTTTLVLQSFWYEGIWGEGDTIYDPEVNSWVKYLDENGVQNSQIIGPIEWGCQEVLASSIVQVNGCQVCQPLTFDTMTTVISENHTSCASIYKISCNNTTDSDIQVHFGAQLNGDALWANGSWLVAADFQVTSNNTYIIPANSSKTFSFGIEVAGHNGGTLSYIVAELLGAAGGTSGQDYFRNHGGGHC